MVCVLEKPEGGLEHPSGAANKFFSGPNHTHCQLTNRYFEYCPNQYYHDVNLNLQRLESLPEDRDALPGLPVIEVPEIQQESDLGPAPKQFTNKVPVDEDDFTRSGIVCPMKPKDVDKELRLTLAKLLGSEDAANEAINEGNVARATLEYNTEQPLNELNTVGFFSMAFPTIFVNGSCDYTTPLLVKNGLW